MTLRLTLVLASALFTGAADAACTGENLINALPTETRAALEAEAATAPYATGNLWHATRGGQHITLIGTFHLADPRHDTTLNALAPDLHAANALLVEAGPKEEAALRADLAQNPSQLIHNGPNLAESLSPADWTRLSSALAARHIPPAFVAKLQPWYIATLLAVPACQFGDPSIAEGLDKRLIQAATAQNLPIKVLEPYDTLLRIFDAVPDADQTDMLLETLATSGALENDTAQTLSDSYFAGESRLFWAFSRYQIFALGYDPQKVALQFDLIDSALMTNRNRTWLPVIEREAAKGPIVVAFGALHLSGETGILNLLGRKGWTVMPW